MGYPTVVLGEEVIFLSDSFEIRTVDGILKDHPAPVYGVIHRIHRVIEFINPVLLYAIQWAEGIEKEIIEYSKVKSKEEAPPENPPPKNSWGGTWQ